MPLYSVHYIYTIVKYKVVRDGCLFFFFCDAFVSVPTGLVVNKQQLVNRYSCINMFGWCRDNKTTRSTSSTGPSQRHIKSKPLFCGLLSYTHLAMLYICIINHVQVTEENKTDYVRLVCQMKMTGAIRKQLGAFLEGFYDIIPRRLISIFNEQELELLLSGRDISSGYRIL